jgi:predicted dehydrogenase
MSNTSDHNDAQFNRRDFVRLGAAAGFGAAIGAAGGCAHAATPKLGPAPTEPFAAPGMDVVRIGFVGVGGMGSGHVNNLLKIEGAQIVAVCDIVESKVKRVQDLVEKKGFPRPTGYSRGDLDFVRMCEEEDLDLVYTATPWRWHVPVCVAAMENGKHAATEIPAAYTVEDCWKLVETAERTKKHCIMQENCLYDSAELIFLNMVKKGLFGELLHGECGYLHDLRGVKFGSGGEGLWRRKHSIERNGDLYPPHGLGPIAQCMDINRGNQFDYLVSMASGARGLHEYAVEKFGLDSDQAKEQYKCGDKVTTLIRTKAGQTIILKHDTNLPRPYSRDVLLQGTKGVIRKYPKALVHVEGRSKPHTWEDLSVYTKEFNHPIRAALEEKSKGAGHGGMDFIEDYRLINALLKGIPTDSDVYDAAALSVVGPISEASIAGGSIPVPVPDFTRGMWRTPRELQVMRPETY